MHHSEVWRRVLEQLPMKPGPGDYTDQASALLDSGDEDRFPEEFRQLRQERAEGYGLARDNPGDSGEEPEILPYQELAELGVLLTGTWGPGGAPSASRRSLPLVGEDSPLPQTSKLPGLYLPFWPRMELLGARLETLLRELPERYFAYWAHAVPGLVSKLGEARRLARQGAAEERALWERRAVALLDKLHGTGYDAAGRRTREYDPGKMPWVSEVGRLVEAVHYVLAQDRRRPTLLHEETLLPFGVRPWLIVAEDGNRKLPFYAYSEMPMASCPGAGVCGVPVEESRRQRTREKGHGWCYSFSSWARAAPYCRQFLNTLAAYTDREFSLMKEAGRSTYERLLTDPRGAYHDRVRASVKGLGQRQWQPLIRDKLLLASAATRESGKTTFLRLFVDGDLGPEDQVLAWMQLCHELGPDSPFREPGEGWVEVYGYSKAWSELVRCDALLRPHLTEEQRGSVAHRQDYGRWPVNYTLNMSGGSIHSGTHAGSVRSRTEALPICRGYFQAIDLYAWMEMLDASKMPSRLPDLTRSQFSFNEERVKELLQLNDMGRRGRTEHRAPSPIAMLADASTLLAPRGGLSPISLSLTKEGVLEFARRASLTEGLPGEGEPSRGAWARAVKTLERLTNEALCSRGCKMDPPVSLKLLWPTRSNPSPRARPLDYQLRKVVFSDFVNSLLLDKNFASLVRDELEKDSAGLNEEEFLEIASRASWRRTHEVVLSRKGVRPSFLEGYTDKELHKKALSVILHEVLWTLEAGGSCPLRCGNCSDALHPTLEEPGVHRCASKGAFRGKVVYIGIHGGGRA